LLKRQGGDRMKHLPFDSGYRPDFEVVEERRGRVSLYPHTEQLPKLWRALNLEFRNPLPNRVAYADHRASGYDKLLRKSAVMIFSSIVNAGRTDDLILHPLFDRNLISQVALVQMITEPTPRGARHSFHFYGGPDFSPEIRLSGHRVYFTDHALQRFSRRVPNNLGEDLSCFLLAFFGAPIISLNVGPGPAFLIDYLGSLMVFPFQETQTEFLVTTCLTIDQISSLELDVLPEGYNQHYDESFTAPAVRNWSPTWFMRQHHRRWQNKAPLPPARPKERRMSWPHLAQRLRDITAKDGHGPASRLVFMDHIPGPNALEIAPGQVEPQFNELAAACKLRPDMDWEGYVRERAAERSRRVLAHL